MAEHLNTLCVRLLRGSARALIVGLVLVGPVRAQAQWDTGIELRGAFPGPTDEASPQQEPDAAVAPPSNTTIIPRTGGPPALETTSAQINLVALLTADGQRIDQGIVWRVYEDAPKAKGAPKLLMTKREPSPTVSLEPGDYVINATFGRADLTRTITVTPGASMSEKFVLNAGGLRAKVLVDGKAPAPNTVSFDIYSGERDQSDNRTKVMSRVKPNLVMRLNAGIYRIVSTYGDANAVVEADVTVEAGKLTEATISHSAARVTFKLVTRVGGEALPDTQWTVQTPEGQVVKRSVGALPTHILAPGTYTIVAKSGARAFKRDFSLANGEIAQVEVLMR
jgi:hypothetical protein